MLIYVKCLSNSEGRATHLRHPFHKVTAWAWAPGKKRFWHQPRCFNVL